MTSKKANKLSPEVPARMVRMVLDYASEHPSCWAAGFDCGQDPLHTGDAA
ncbi:hypothetical protein IVA79_27650 [Bradyrhizobium sp. 138]|nr:hypothetical protein [Bradyrhizobium sp. 138]